MLSKDGKCLQVIKKTHKFSKKVSYDKYLNTILKSSLDMLSLHGKCENHSSIWILSVVIQHSPLFQQTSQLC